MFGSKGHEESLLNSILNGKPQINSVELGQTEYKKIKPTEKSIRMDIVATTDNGTIVNIEMQCVNDGSIVDRASFYQARLRVQSLLDNRMCCDRKKSLFLRKEQWCRSNFC